LNSIFNELLNSLKSSFELGFYRILMTQVLIIRKVIGIEILLKLYDYFYLTFFQLETAFMYSLFNFNAFLL